MGRLIVAGASPVRAASRKAAPRPRPPRHVGRATPTHERAWIAGLLVVHLALATWGAVRQSVTFDENSHLPAGVLIAALGELHISMVNPPLVKALAGAAALAAGARVPSRAEIGRGEPSEVGFAFMRLNADRYQRVYVAGRLVIVFLSGLLALVVWRWARRLWGPRGALVALAFYAFAPEALAHAGVVTMDLPTALGFVFSLMAWQAFVTHGRWRAWAATAVGVAFTFLVRFTAVFLPPLLLVLAIAQVASRRARAPRRVWLGYALLIPSTFLAIQLGYLGHTTWLPLHRWSFNSHVFQSVGRLLPDLRLPLPDSYVAGFDRQAIESQAGATPSFLLREVHREMPIAYFPIALAAKWPLGFLAALALLAGYVIARRPRLCRILWPLSLVLLFLWIVMFVGRLGVGIRYLFPIVPALCVLLGGLASGRVMHARAASRDAAWWRRAALVLAALQSFEACAHAPWHLSFFNALAGGPAGGQWIVNDSNIDWGQGLIALREELARRGIRRVHLAYHGTTEPSVYGIDYVPYFGGVPGPESDWLAISSYYFVGESQRMTLRAGRTPQSIHLDFTPLWGQRPVCRPAGCMLLFDLRRLPGAESSP